MIRLVKLSAKVQQLISLKGRVEPNEAGIIIRFDENDGRKPGHAVLIDKDSIENLSHELIDYLEQEKQNDCNW